MSARARADFLAALGLRGATSTNLRCDSLQIDLLGWYRSAARDLPWRRTRNPYRVWISEVMLQQTTVTAVLPYYERFLAKYPDVFALARSSEEDLLAMWSGLGYYRRARNLRAAARLLVERHGGRFPTDVAGLRALPGIGRYTAGAIASVCFGVRAAAVDGNAARVISRLFALEQERAPGARRRPSSEHRANLLSEPRTIRAAFPGASLEAHPRAGRRSHPGNPGGVHSSTPLAVHSSTTSNVHSSMARGAHPSTTRVSPAPGSSTTRLPRGTLTGRLWAIAEALVPAEEPGEWTQALMEIGARICRPAAPDCARCPVSSHCQAFAEGNPIGYTPGRARRAQIDVRASVIVLERRARVLFVRRPDDELLGGLWELPGTVAHALRGVSALRRASRAGTSAPRRAEPRAGRLAQARGPRSSERDAKAADTVSHHARNGRTELLRALRGDLQLDPASFDLHRVGLIRHTVTYHRLEIDAWRAQAPRLLPDSLAPIRGKHHRWVGIDEMDKIPIGAMSRKVLAAISSAAVSARPR